MTHSPKDIREKIIEAASQNGGHLAPSLGVVELTIALHSVFKSPKDSFVWDVGHQSYAHKILTGRAENFGTIRTLGGLSGFPKRSESEHDPFGTGHSSTSISAALGIAEAKRMSGDRGKTVAIIGDGSLTGGLAFEGLNNAGHLQNQSLIVVFNDNQMSIDKNVGALANFINKGLAHPTYNRLRRDAKTLLKILSAKDVKLVEMTRRAAMVVKDFFLAGSLFEALGFRYFGPIDGHDLNRLTEVFKTISDDIDADPEKGRPAFVHVITQKGKGFEPAENDPTKYHGIAPLRPQVKIDECDCAVSASLSASSGNVPTYTSVFGSAMCEMMSADSRVVAITAAMPSGTGLDKVKDKFPNRYYDVGIAEQHAVVFAAGLATRGYKPVFAVYSSFLQRAYDQIIHDVCLQNLPVIFAVDRAGVVGEDGPTHHGVFDLSFLRSIPSICIMCPSDEEELRRMMWTAIAHHGPVAIRYPRGRGLGVALSSERTPISFGKSRVVLGDGAEQIVLVGVGHMLAAAKDAAKCLCERGFSAMAVDARFAKPIDEAFFLDQLREGKTVVTIEDNVLAGGFGSALLELANVNGISAGEVIRFGYEDVFVEHGPVPDLHKIHGLTGDSIAKRVCDALSSSQSKGGKVFNLARQ